MKKVIILTGLFFALQIQAQDLLKGPHGGELFRAPKYNIEKVNAGYKTYAYLYDIYMLPVSNKQIEAKLELFFPGEVSCELKLLPCEENSFCGVSGMQTYSYCVIYFNLGSEVVWGKFYNYSSIAKSVALIEDRNKIR